jgi:KamA family protein
VRYLQQHDDISEVILSGGDPLMLSDDKLAQLIQQLNRIPHIQSLRIHSRLLSVLPERITQNLMNILQQFSGQVVFVTHINHANEISENNQNIFKLISQQGHHIFNQSVLLKQVNDNVTALKTLSFKLFESSVIPYYLHRLDKVQGAAHFDLPSEISCQLYRQLEQQLPGYLLPRMVDEISGRLSKTTAHCC